MPYFHQLRLAASYQLKVCKLLKARPVTRNRERRPIVLVLKAVGAAALLWLHTLLYSIWNTGIIPTGWRRGVVTLSGRERVTLRSVTTTGVLPPLRAGQGPGTNSL